MNKIYSTDECNDLSLFLKEIKKWQKEGKIEWTKIDMETYKILDLDLSEIEIKELNKFFDELDVYEISEVDEDEDWDPYFDEEEGDDYSGYSRKRYNSDEDDDL